MYICEVSEAEAKVLPYLLTSVGSGADPGVPSVSLQLTLSYPPGGAITFCQACSYLRSIYHMAPTI